MFGDLMGNLEQHQADMKKKLTSFPVEIHLEGIRLTGNASKQLVNVEIDETLMALEHKEQLEDLILICFHRFLEKASEIESTEAQNLMENMLPPGFENLFK